RRRGPAVQVGRAGEDRDQRGHINAEDSACLHIGGVVGADLVAYPVREQTRIECACPAEESNELGVNYLIGRRRWSEIQSADRPIPPTMAVLAARLFEQITAFPEMADPVLLAVGWRDRRANPQRDVGGDRVEISASPCVCDWRQIRNLRQASGAFRYSEDKTSATGYSPDVAREVLYLVTNGGAVQP